MKHTATKHGFSPIKRLFTVVLPALAMTVLSILCYGRTAYAADGTDPPMATDGWTTDKTIALIIAGSVLVLLILGGVLTVVLQSRKKRKSIAQEEPLSEPPQTQPPAASPAATYTTTPNTTTQTPDWESGPAYTYSGAAKQDQDPSPMYGSEEEDEDTSELTRSWVRPEPDTEETEDSQPVTDEDEPIEEKAPAPVKKAATKTATKKPAAKKPAAKTTAKKTAAKKPAAAEPRKRMGKYVIAKAESKFRFNLKAPNGQLLYESRDYSTKQTCTSGVDTFRRAVEVGNFTIDDDKSGRFKFRLQAHTTFYEGETLATREGVENVIASIKHNALSQTIETATDNETKSE